MENKIRNNNNNNKLLNIDQCGIWEKTKTK